eukprot:3280116-Amphidinium_carterae.1
MLLHVSHRCYVRVEQCSLSAPVTWSTDGLTLTSGRQWYAAGDDDDDDDDDAEDDCRHLSSGRSVGRSVGRS